MMTHILPHILQLNLVETEWWVIKIVNYRHLYLRSGQDADVIIHMLHNKGISIVRMFG